MIIKQGWNKIISFPLIEDISDKPINQNDLMVYKHLALVYYAGNINNVFVFNASFNEYMLNQSIKELEKYLEYMQGKDWNQLYKYVIVSTLPI